MPTYITHQLIAEDIYAQLPATVKAQIATPYYYFGAQGADIGFFYGLPNVSPSNLGKILHHIGDERTFLAFSRICFRSREAYSYTLGYLTHYATDITFHPYVYALVKRAKEDKKRGLWHTLLEGDMDTYFLREKRGERACAYHLPYRIRDLQLEEVFSLYREVGKEYGKRVKFRRFRACTRHYYFFLKTSADRKFRSVRFWSWAEGKLHLPKSVSVLYKREQPDLALFNLERKEWRYPTDDTRTSTDSVDDLYEKAVALGVQLIASFLSAREKGEEPSAREFGKNFLTGV